MRVYTDYRQISLLPVECAYTQAANDPVIGSDKQPTDAQEEMHVMFPSVTMLDQLGIRNTLENKQ